MKKLKDYLFALIPAVLVLCLVLLEPFYSPDAMLSDLLYSQLSGTGSTIKLVCVDEETLEAYGSFTGFSRAKSAELINLLYENTDSAPAVVAFDMMFVGDTDEQTDAMLADACSDDRNVVVASNLVYRGKILYRNGGIPVYDSWNIDGEERAYDSLDARVRTGFANVSRCKDGFVRTSNIRTTVDGQTRYSFAAEIAKAYADSTGSTDIGLEDIPDIIQFFYSGKPGEYEHYSMVDVLEGRVPTTVFKDGIVIVGAYAPGMMDSYHTPARRSKEMYGVEINANILSAVMNGKYATKVSPVIVALICAAIVYLYTLLARRMKMYPALIVGVWILLGGGIIARVLATRGHIVSVLYFVLTVLLVMVSIIIEKYVYETVKRRRVVNTFKKYMAPQVVDSFVKENDYKIELGGLKRQVAVLFVDIRGFTTMSEALEPETVVGILNKYLSLMNRCIFDNGGMLDKFIGDAAMAVFNAPNDLEDYAYKAVKTGLDMKTYGEGLSAELLKEYGRTVSFGVGINIGEAVVGNIGSDVRMDYTAIGDTVNTAARLESRALSGEVLISEPLYDILKDRIIAEYKDEMTLKGKSETVRVYSVHGLK